MDRPSPDVIAIDARDQHLALVVVDEKSSDHDAALTQCSRGMARNLQENQTEHQTVHLASVLTQGLQLDEQGNTRRHVTFLYH